MSMLKSEKPKVVVIGGGFAGLACVRSLKGSDVDVKLIDRRNFHLFQPLLYQVATGALSPANIAAPLRSIFKRQRNVQVLLGEVSGFDIAQQKVILNSNTEVPFDYLIIASGSTHHYFGRDAEWQSLAPGLKTVEDATTIRRMILSAFEKAELTSDLEEQKRLLTFVVVGGGPTGVEMAGAICELSRQTMKNDFRSIDPTTARVILVENSKLMLDKYHPSLSVAAGNALRSMGVELWNECKLQEIHSDHVIIAKASQSLRVDTSNIIWAAGVKASELGKQLSASIDNSAVLDRGGRVIVDQQCSIQGLPHVFVVGDLAAFSTGDGKTLPGIAPVAMQQGAYVGSLIAKRLKGWTVNEPFRYWDKGTMATIGRSRAVLESGNVRLSGRIAWVGWLFIHIMYLARFENRILVLFQWFWNYITRNRSARLITGERSAEPDKPS